MAPRRRNLGASRQDIRKTKAKVRDLESYLGDDWIDYGVISADIVVEMYRDIATSAYQPKKCPDCNQYWSMYLDSKHKKAKRYLKNSVFGGIPAIKETCWECD